ncbi:phosphatidylinositol-glycan biosynthesis class S protein [Zychaea mexicana]|uniref:phosphatidylinositol-glycan biosynthesis class S protein n=1 Tax=Zychaea mexicana TaxID=64656 RepID=UPI0022FE8478|nr:phosphatidylinositol-glycan biosynthesis class S protein [Zychaea mexicana]KAI9496455.1 phosphatidylinositol-glycan biosynthesis class S protein [Zychaea mexicana]
MSNTRLVVASFWAFFLIGLPFWWKTTEVYRANLPFADIESWRTGQSCSFVFPTTFILHIPHSLQYNDKANKALQRRLSTEFNKQSSCAEFPVEVRYQSWHKEENEVTRQDRDAPVGHYHIFIDQPMSSTKQSIPYNITVGNARTSVIEMEDMSVGNVEKAVYTLTKMVFGDEYQTLDRIACRADQTRDRNDMSSMRALKYSPRYQVTFSMMNNDPTRLIVDWDIQEAVKGYVYPLLRELSMVSNFTVDSQVQNYASLSMKPQFRERDGKAGYYYLNPENLPHFINSADWNLASTISSHATINFILYVPSPDERLWIHDKQGQPLPGNAFSIPGWGGVVIKNPPPPHTLGEDHHYVMDKKRLQPVMRIFVSQLRTLLGIQDFSSATTQEFNVTFMPSPHTGITLLEKDTVIRRRTVENIVNAASTLSSLAQLVSEIPNMVVLDHIALQVQQSLHALDLGCHALQTGGYDAALQHSIHAIELAEEAFFNPTMVSMLYFPDEHKYAIYMPLFVPIAVPLLMAVIKGLKGFKKTEKAKTE